MGVKKGWLKKCGSIKKCGGKKSKEKRGEKKG